MCDYSLTRYIPDKIEGQPKILGTSKERHIILGIYLELPKILSASEEVPKILDSPAHVFGLSSMHTMKPYQVLIMCIFMPIPIEEL